MDNSKEPPKTIWKNKKYNSTETRNQKKKYDDDDSDDSNESDNYESFTSLLDQYLPSSFHSKEKKNIVEKDDDDDDELYIDMLDHDYTTTFEPLSNINFNKKKKEQQKKKKTKSQQPKKKRGGGAIPPTPPPPQSPIKKTMMEKPKHNWNKKNVFDETILQSPPVFKPFSTHDDYKENVPIDPRELKLRYVSQKKKEMEKKRDSILNEIINKITPSSKIVDNMRKMTKNFNATTFREFIKSVVNYIPYSIDYYIYYASYSFAKVFYKVKGTTNKSPDLNADADTLKTLSYSLLAIPLAYYLTYNWWFLFHKEDVYIDYATLLEKSPPLNFFFECTIQPTNIINYILLGLKDDSAKSIFSSLGEEDSIFSKFKGLFFLFILFIIYYILRYQSSYFNKTLNDIIDSKQNTLYSLTFAIVIISYFFKDAFNIERLSKMASILGSPLFILIALLVKFLFIMITVPFSLPILFIYLIIHSFFGIAMNKGFSEIWDVINIIDFEIENSFPNPETNNCFETSSLSNILYYLNKYLFRFLLPILSFAVCMFGIKNIATIKSAQLQLLVMTFYFIVLTIIGFSAYRKATSSV